MIYYRGFLIDDTASVADITPIMEQLTKDVENMNKSEQPDGSLLYVRAGDGDGYNDFTDLESAIDYLQEVRVTGPLTKYDAYQYESPSMNSKLSIYWGESDEMANPVRSLTPEELKLVNLALPESTD